MPTELMELLLAELKGSVLKEQLKMCKEAGKSFSRIARWAKSKSLLSPTPPFIPHLTNSRGSATTPKAKCDTLKTCFFLPISLAETSYIPVFQYFAQKPFSMSITIEKIVFALSKACFHKALGPDTIPMYYFKLLWWPLLEYLQPLFEACFHFS
jgi:hypothetical protein